MGWKIRRQHVLQGYIVDFVCLEHKIIIELDGGHHTEQESYDERRTKILGNDGYTVIRFWNNDVVYRLEDVLTSILSIPHPPVGRPLPQGERFNLRQRKLSNMDSSSNLMLPPTRFNLRQYPIGKRHEKNPHR